MYHISELSTFHVFIAAVFVRIRRGALLYQRDTEMNVIVLMLERVVHLTDRCYGKLYLFIGFGVFEQELDIHSDIPKGGHFLITSGIWEGVDGHLVSKDGVDKWTVEIEFCKQFITTIINPTQFKMIPLED